MDRQSIWLFETAARFFYPLLSTQKRYQQFLNLPKHNKLFFIWINTLFRIAAIALAILLPLNVLDIRPEEEQMSTTYMGGVGGTLLLISASMVAVEAVALVLLIYFWFTWTREYLAQYSSLPASEDNTRNEPISLRDILTTGFVSPVRPDGKSPSFRDLKKGDKLFYVVVNSTLVLLAAIMIVVTLLGDSEPHYGSMFRSSAIDICLILMVLLMIVLIIKSRALQRRRNQDSDRPE